MKITTKHRIAYKDKDAPGEPVEMGLYRDEAGDIRTTTGDKVARESGEPSLWVQRIIDGTGADYEGYIIAPPFEPYVGMVLERVDDPNYTLVCFTDTSNWDEPSWISPTGLNRSHSDIAALLKKGELRIREVQK